MLLVLDLGAQTSHFLRRPVSPQQPMYLVHIDTWNYADPQKIIDLIPEDIRPYVVMNISLSISHNAETSQFQVAEYGYEIAKSWLRTCAQNQMWATVQHSSGGYAQFSDSDLSVYQEFYTEFPNLIGFNYAEQFWGYDDPNDPLSPKWNDRITHFANLLELSNKYGGYLIVSWCGNQWSPPINPIGMLKRNPAFANACEKYSHNYLLFEKYTQESYQSDMESLCLGAYLSGYSGNYGIRYDDTGWTDSGGNHSNFTMASAGAVHLEHIMLTGATMIDGPELIWTQCFREKNRKASTNGYSMRDWETYPQFINTTVDYFRKILDGTVRIPSRKEVIDRTKYVIINDVNSGSSDMVYSSPETLFEGLYRMDGDGNLRNNKSFFKKTGRFPTIPVVYNLNDNHANSFKYKINHSDYSSRWPSITNKINEFNNEFASEYSGNLYAGRIENGWVIYNPYKTGQTASANIPFRYNTSDSIALNFSQYEAAVMKEYDDSITFYLSNYDNQLNKNLKTDEIKFYGCSHEPTFSYSDRGNHQASVLSSSWTNNVFTLTIKHNGPLDIIVKCSGQAKNRLTAFSKAILVVPEMPSVYTGPRQYEAECFDYKNISDIITGGQYQPIRNYTGQGYLKFGTRSNAAVRDTVYALRSGVYDLLTRYSLVGGSVNTIDIYINGAKVASPVFNETDSESHWQINQQSVMLKAGKNVIEFIANAAAPKTLIIDNIVISQGSEASVYHFENDSAKTEASVPPANLISIKSGAAGVVEYRNTDGYSGNAFKAYSAGMVNSTGVANLDMFNSLAANYSIVWKEYYKNTGAVKGLMLRASSDKGMCSYAEGMMQGYLFMVTNNPNNTITLGSYVADTLNLNEKATYTSMFKIMPGEPCWYRAKAFNNMFLIECSPDSVNWFGGVETCFTDNSFATGKTQLLWGFGSSNYEWIIDDVQFFAENITVSKFSMDDYFYRQGAGPSLSQDLSVKGNALSGDIEINTSEYFEVSLHPTEGFDSSFVLEHNEGEVLLTNVYVRLKSNLPIGEYVGELLVASGGMLVQSVVLHGRVTPQATIEVYDFTNDIASNAASDPPALNTQIAPTNTATGGVISFADLNGISNNMLKPYGGGQRNATGVIDLQLFSKKATDYSVTWKQFNSDVNSDYKVGMLLRGDTLNFGTDTEGYVQGLMHGYLFIVYNTNTGSQFRIYKSNDTYNSLFNLVNSSVPSLKPASRQAVWYRASVNGENTVSLTFEYSTDGVKWNVGANTSDNTAPVYKSGATQIVWGLAANALNFVIDDISFNGLTENSGALPEFINVSERFLSNFKYVQGCGPSVPFPFFVSADSLLEDIVIRTDGAYELSFDSLAAFDQVLTIENVNGKINDIPVFVRLKSGLMHDRYLGELIIQSQGVASRFITLSGVVEPGPEITVSTVALDNFAYKKDLGPSGNQSFLVSAKLLFEDLLIDVPDYFEMKLAADNKYASSINLSSYNGDISSTRIYVRLKSGLAPGDYHSNLVLNSRGAISQYVSLNGSVWQENGVFDQQSSDAEVLQVEYFNLTGQRIYQPMLYKGLLIERKIMSDGRIMVNKIIELKD
ncbi:MAG: hypothetical protein JW735_07930 [Prolixibacteraceae bacterium]|nr:hypothetical protein [Prolixibacteraceae bacterium]